MIENLQWILSGIGTELLMLLIGTLVGVVGYKIIRKNGGKQVQRAKSGARQRQEMTVDSDITVREKGNEQNSIRQTQKAGKGSEQVQIGRIENGKR